MTAVGHADRRVLITAAPPTPNGDLHLGHLSGPYSGADILTRACRLTGAEALFLTGSDLHQSYVPVKAAAMGLDPLEMADTFAAEIAAIFEAAGFTPDAYVVPQRSELHVRMVSEFFARLHDRGALRERTEPGLFCQDCQRYLFEAYVTGRCPHCGAASDGNSCENCALPNRCVDLADPKCNVCGGQPEARPVKRLVFPLGRYSSRLRSFHAAADMSPQLEALCAAMLNQALPDIPVSHPTDWGIKVPVPGFGDQRIYVWAEMLAGYFAELAHALKAAGRNPADWSAVWNDPATEIVQFFGFDNGYFHAVLQPALLMAYDPSFKLPTALVTNEFYQLGSSKFSTSRRHAIWAGDLLAAVPASAVRFVLARDRPEAERTSFGWDRFGDLAEGVLAGRWQAWLGDLFCRLTEHAGGQIPAATRLNRSHETFLNTLRQCACGIVDAYRPERFSPRRAARLLSELVCCAADFAAGQARTRGRQDEAASSALAVEAAAALALAKLAAPIMPAFAEQLWRQGERGRRAGLGPVRIDRGAGIQPGLPAVRRRRGTRRPGTADRVGRPVAPHRRCDAGDQGLAGQLLAQPPCRGARRPGGERFGHPGERLRGRALPSGLGQEYLRCQPIHHGPGAGAGRDRGGPGRRGDRDGEGLGHAVGDVPAGLGRRCQPAHGARAPRIRGRDVHRRCLHRSAGCQQRRRLPEHTSPATARERAQRDVAIRQG